MNRSHSYNDIIKCISLIKKRFNKFQFRFNLWIAKYVNLTLAKTLEQAINLSPSHLSCYCLTIEKETVFHKMLMMEV